MTPVPFTPEQLEQMALKIERLATPTATYSDYRETGAMLRQAAAQARELAAAHKRLDDEQVPREDAMGTFSLSGRIDALYGKFDAVLTAARRTP